MKLSSIRDTKTATFGIATVTTSQTHRGCVWFVWRALFECSASFQSCESWSMVSCLKDTIGKVFIDPKDRFLTSDLNLPENIQYSIRTFPAEQFHGCNIGPSKQKTSRRGIMGSAKPLLWAFVFLLILMFMVP